MIHPIVSRAKHSLKLHESGDPENQLDPREVRRLQSILEMWNVYLEDRADEDQDHDSHETPWREMAEPSEEDND